MAEYIERDAFLQWVHEFRADDKGLVSAVINAPAKDVDPIVHGKWEKTSKCYGAIAGHCSICGLASGLWYVNMPYKYCPYCGARMDGDRE